MSDVVWYPPGLVQSKRYFWGRATVRGTDDCWPWQGPVDRDGYGKWGRGSRIAHRVAYELVVGEIPPGLVLDHLCRNRACVNPTHLEPVTLRENVLRGARLRRPELSP